MHASLYYLNRSCNRILVRLYTKYDSVFRVVREIVLSSLENKVKPPKWAFSIDGVVPTGSSFTDMEILQGEGAVHSLLSFHYCFPYS